MNLRGIVAVSGKPGLFKVIGQNKSGFVLEGLDAQKIKLVVNLSTAKLASLEDITVFGEDDDLKLVEILENIKKSTSVPDPKADGKTLRDFFREVAPGHDEDKVYGSDMKKIITWYNLLKDLPLFNEEPSAEPEVQEEPVAAEPELVEEKAAPKAKKSKKAE